MSFAAAAAPSSPSPSPSLKSPLPVTPAASKVSVGVSSPSPCHVTPASSSSSSTLSPGVHRSPPSSHSHVTHRASEHSPAASDSSSPAVRIGVRASPHAAAGELAQAQRPPSLDLSTPNSNSPVFSPSHPHGGIRRLSSLPLAASPPSHSHSPRANTGAAASQSPAVSSPSAPAPPLSFRLKLSSLEVSSPHAEPIVLSSPPSSGHSASVPSPRTVFTSRVPRLLMPEDDSGSSASSSPSQRPSIPRLQLNVSSSPLSASFSALQSGSQHGFRHALNPIVMSSSGADSSSPHAQGGSPALPMGNSSHDRAKRLAFYSKQCTAITPFLSVAGRAVASNLQTLRQCGVTHIVNLVGDLCDNYFPDLFVYSKWFLLDHAGEDIMCVLYPVIELVEECREKGGRVLIHCQQGVSRSCVLCIAYVMWQQQCDYDTAFQFVRQRRGVCRPNVGFMAQLIAWQRRMSAAVHPLCLYRLAPHCTRDHSIVAKWVDRVDLSGLDDRGVFVLHSHHCLYVWVGCSVGLSLLEILHPEALRLCARLRRFEHAIDNTAVLYQKDERLSAEHQHSTASAAGTHSEQLSNSSSYPSLTSSSPNDSGPASPIDRSFSPPPVEPVFPASYTASQRFWSLLGGGSPHSSYRNHGYDEDYDLVMLSNLPQRPASVPLPAMLSARSVSSPESTATTARTGKAAPDDAIPEEDEKRGDEEEPEHRRVEKEAQSVSSSSASASSSSVSPPASSSSSSPPVSLRSQTEGPEFSRRRSYHKSIDAGYLTSAHDHEYASITAADDDDGKEEEEITTLPHSRSLTHRVQQLSVSQPLPSQSLSAREEQEATYDEDEDEDMSESRNSASSSSSSAVPAASLYAYPSWENIDHFDSDDLQYAVDKVFVLVMLRDHTESSASASRLASASTSPSPSSSPVPLSPPQMVLHLWFGNDVQAPARFGSYEVWAEAIAIESLSQFHPLKRERDDNVQVIVQRQGHETEQFWQAFADG